MTGDDGVHDGELCTIVEQLWVALVPDVDGGEGIAVAHLRGVDYPLIAADLERLEQIRGIAEKVARESGRPVTIVRFVGREVIETIRR